MNISIHSFLTSSGLFEHWNAVVCERRSRENKRSNTNKLFFCRSPNSVFLCFVSKKLWQLIKRSALSTYYSRSGHTKDLEHGTFGYFRPVQPHAKRWWVSSREQFRHGAATDSPPLQCSIYCGSSRVVHGASKRRWAPQTTRDTPDGVPSECNEAENSFFLFEILFE